MSFLVNKITFLHPGFCQFFNQRSLFPGKFLGHIDLDTDKKIAFALTLHMGKTSTAKTHLGFMLGAGGNFQAEFFSVKRRNGNACPQNSFTQLDLTVNMKIKALYTVNRIINQFGFDKKVSWRAAEWALIALAGNPELFTRNHPFWDFDRHLF